MSSTDVAPDSVQLQYELTPDDLLDGVAAQLRVVRIPWYLRWLPTLLMIGVSATFILYAWFRDIPAANITALAIAFGVMALVVFGVTFVRGRRLSGLSRLAYRTQARQIVRANPGLSGPTRTTITDTGVRLSSVASEISVGWEQYPLHMETDRSFVLIASQRRGAAVLVLPKRGLAESDPAPLRALIAAHSRRLT